MSTEEFSPPVVQELAPYIRSREEVAHVRRRIQQYLQRSLGHDRFCSVALLPLEPPASINKSSPEALAGLRKAYWKALQAHHTAQMKHEALKAELLHLSHAKQSNLPESSDLGDDLLPILRQRERLRKLQVIDRCFTTIISKDTAPSMNSVDEITRQRVGLQPDPPSLQLHTSSRGEIEIDGQVSDLKRAVLSMKHKSDMQCERPSQTNGAGDHRSQNEIPGLQRALNVLTAWMEEQLSLIGETENHTHGMELTVHTKSDKLERVSSPADIELLYEQYLNARENLVRTLHSPQQHDLRKLLLQEDDIIFSQTDKRTPSSSEILLPYIPALTTMKREEQSLLQQTSFLRSSIAKAEGEASRLISRMAEESHLVQAGAPGGKAWATAAREAANMSGKTVAERTRQGEAFVAAAEQAMRETKGVLDMLDGLKADRQ